MIYVDASVILAHLFGEGRRPPPRLWKEPPVSGWITAYEVWTRLHAHGLGTVLGDAARLALGHLAMLELVPPVLARASEPFPLAVGTLDALYLASIDFLRAHGQPVQLAAYDRRLADAAHALGIPRYRL